MDSAETAPPGSSAKSQPAASSPTKEKGDEDPASRKATARKRTKTGCLTCRKRRIKCDEGRPTCNNCIKSKRQCEGYNQRVIFKDPLGAFSPFGPMPLYPQASPQALVREQQLTVAQQKSSSQSLQVIAPKPPLLGYHPSAIHHFNHVFPGQHGPAGSPPLNFDPNLPVYGMGPPPPSSKYTFFQPETVDAFAQQNQWRQETQLEPRLDLGHYSPTNPNGHGTPIVPQHGLPELDKGKAHAEAQGHKIVQTQFGEWSYPVPDNDASMGDSDDELVPGSKQDSQIVLNELGLIVLQRLNDRFDSFGTQPRTFTAPDHVPVMYEPSFGDSPLNDQHIASVFCHFVNVTGPSMSLYERHPFDTTPYPGGTTLRPRQHIWTYTFPILSFNHPALLQAILALGSLQIAKLDGVPPTASLKHYHLALRRVARNIGRPSKRTQPSNLAATLLLAYYEVWNSDHEKWSKHLLGARWIIKDIPYREMTRCMMAIKRQIRERKERKEQQQQQQIPYDPYGDGSFAAFGIHSHPDGFQNMPEPLYSDWDDISVPLLTSITGRMVTYEEMGMVPGERDEDSRRRAKFTEKDMDTYEQLSDLFWWYCKMDVYQSVLGGTKLFMDYDLWTQCPPRAPMGRLDAIYGTYDHLMLLLGRLANFNSRDLTRKRRVWGRRGTFGPSGAPPGTFPGMMPASARVAMPMGFSPPRDDVPSPKSDLDDQDLDALTAIAMREWEGIKAGFEALREHFGPHFEPMGPDMIPGPVELTPFGPAAKYRTYSIAGIWMNYYMGMIMLHRAHPEMPPVAMMAAGMSAQHTMRYAIEIGRIAAGLEENVAMLQAVSTLVGAAFIESAFCLFVAGVQYQDEHQRHWLVRRLHDIARLTGWQSARQIADGCESAWSKAAQMGRGPVYTRAPELSRILRTTQSVWGNPRRIDRRIQEVPDDNSQKIVLAKEEKAHYALGILGVQEDLERLDLETGEKGSN